MADVEVPPLPADAPRVSEGRYVLLTRLGEGGMAVVYGAWDQDLRIWRAVKVLLPEYARRGSVRKRFRREAETMMSVRHPNLVRVVEVNAERALPYMVMDLIPGGSLQEWALRNGQMPPRMAVEAALQICRGLQAVHDAGIVHRDIKPQNVLVDLDGTCKLTDFGVARVDGGDTKTGVAMGTVGYMAPEQLADSKSVDARSDLYSVGASLYVLITKATVRDLFRVADDPRKLEGLPEPLVPVLRKCLQYEREDRFPDVAALAAALAEVMPALPPVPDGTPPLPRGPRDGKPGIPAGEFTELQGMMDTTNPTFTDEVDAEAPPLPTPTPLPDVRPDETPASLQGPAAERVHRPSLLVRVARLAALAALVGVMLTGLAVVIAVPTMLALGWGG